MASRMIRTPSKITVIIPALNEEANVGEVVKKIMTQLQSRDLEIIIVDDGSQDGTTKMVEKIAQSDPRIFGIKFTRNFGHQAALKAGLDHASGDCVISMDCDLEHPPELLPEMVSKWEEGFDVVLTQRRATDQLPWTKIILSKTFYKVLNFMSETTIESGSADFRLLDRRVADVCRSLQEYDLFWRGLIPWLGFTSVTIPYHQGIRKSGQSNYSLKRMLRLSIAGITGFSVRPLHLSLLLGFFMMTGALGYLLYALYIKFFTLHTVSGWASLVAVIVMTSGIHMMILGIIGLYIGKIFVQSKQRPVYIIERLVGSKR